MSEELIEVRRGTAVGVLTPSTEDDFAYINANLREMDKFEQDHFLKSGTMDHPDSLDMMEAAWTLHLKGEIVGFVGLQIAPLQSPLSTSRFVPMLSTVNVEHHPLDYARLSRPILECVAAHAKPWVRDFFSVPLAKYEASVRWHEKTMGWHRAAEYDLFGEKAILFHLTRKELTK